MAGAPIKLRRRFFRFGIRTFLVVVVGLSVWLAWFVYRVERQKNAVAWVIENGGSVVYDYEMNADGVDDEPDLPAPKWLVNLIGIDYFSSVVDVMIQGTHSGDRLVLDLSPLQGFPRLESLYLASVDSADWSPISKLENLYELILEYTNFDDLTLVSDLTDLEALNLSFTRVDDVTPLVKLHLLEDLNLRATKIQCIQSLRSLKRLQYLNLIGTQVDDFETIVCLKNLNTLLISFPITDDEARKLQNALPTCTIFALRK